MRRRFITPEYLQKVLGDGLVIPVKTKKTGPRAESPQSRAAFDEQVADFFEAGFKAQLDASPESDDRD